MLTYRYYLRPLFSPVGEVGVLVHNSAFENTTRTITDIYCVESADRKIVYVGKTIQGIDTRFQQHIANRHPEWENGYRPVRLERDNWTLYEASVWEQHFVDTYGGRDALENRQVAISQKKYFRFKTLHAPC